MTIPKKEIFNAGHFKELLNDCDSDLDIFRDTLKSGRDSLRQHFFNGAHGQDIVYSHAWLVDQLIILAFKHHLTRFPDASDVSLVAVGGYGRGELHPASDIDIMLLLHRPSDKAVNAFIESLLRFLWDVGMDVGHSVRTVKDCVHEAKKDVTVATNIMETRLLHGDQKLFDKMMILTGPQKFWPSRKFFIAKRDEQIHRHARFDDTGYNLEPNVKEGPGGLRDLQVISWVTQRQFGTGALHELVRHGFLTEKEYGSLIQGRDYLWHVRNGLHYLAERREDRLLFDHQRTLADHEGFKDKSGSLAVEQFMKRYYRTIKELSLLNEILLQHFQEVILARKKPRIRTLNRRFRIRGDFLETVNENVFERTPLAMLELFLLLQQNQDIKGVRADTIRQLRNNLHKIDKKLRTSIAARSLFMEIMRQPRGITHELRRMNAYGVLGAYIPVFGRIVGQMQHDLFHVYTVDEHILFVLRNLRRLTVHEFHDEFPLASKIIGDLVKPERIYIAALFHDIAKGRGGDHSELGEKEAKRFCKTHVLSEYDTRLVCWLVRHHLFMSMVAQRQDIHDLGVIREFAQKMGDIEHLDNLYLLTVADIRGTSPAVWNEWKRGLLIQLYSETRQMLRRGFAQPIDLDANITDKKEDVLTALTLDEDDENRVQQFWHRMGKDYFLRHDITSLGWHASKIISTLDNDLPLVSATFESSVGATEVMVYTLDSEGLFCALTGALDKLGLSVVDARVHTAEGGYVLDTFFVLDNSGKAITGKREHRHIAASVRKDLVLDKAARPRSTAHLSRQMKHFPVETRVQFSPSINGKQTIMEITTQDRPGLLHRIAQVLVGCKVRLITARIATYGERAEDIFFITDYTGNPITDTVQLEQIEKEILQRLAV